jgi:ribosomal protein L7Ae-like RNA K-turn-binding protein
VFLPLPLLSSSNVPASIIDDPKRIGHSCGLSRTGFSSPAAPHSIHVAPFVICVLVHLFIWIVGRRVVGTDDVMPAASSGRSRLAITGSC